MSPFRFHRRLVASALMAAAASLAVAGSASASPYEQVARADGPFGGTPYFDAWVTGTAVGDVGRYAGWERQRHDPAGGEKLTEGFVRDVQLNKTYDYGGGVQKVYAIDRAERRSLVLRQRAGQLQVAAFPIAGGVPLIVAQFPVADFPSWVRPPAAALSGDGRKVVVSAEGSGTKLYDLTGGVVRLQRELSDEVLWHIDPREIDDKANVVAGFQSGGDVLLYVNGVERRIVGVRHVAVDPAGTVAAYVDPTSIEGATLVLLNLRTGTERRWPVPPYGFSGDVLWVAPGGTKIVVGGYQYGDEFGARAFAPATATWSSFGGRFSTSIFSDPTYGIESGTVLSASGRFAVTGVSGVGLPGILLDTTGAHIIGANEGLAASAYVLAGSFVRTCDVPAEFFIYLVNRTPYAPKPRRVTYSAKVDGRVFMTGTLTESLPFGIGGNYQVPEDWPSGRADYDARGGDVELTVTVVDGAGRVLTDKWIEPDPYCGG